MTKSTVTSKGQTTIPKEIRRKLQIKTGDVLQWETCRSSAQMRIVQSAFLRRRGSIKAGAGFTADDVRRARKAMGLAKV